MIKVNEFIIDMFDKVNTYDKCRLIVMDVDTDKALINVNFNNLLFKSYKVMKKYQLISYTSDLHYDIKNGFNCSNVIIWARKIEKEEK